VRGSLSSLPAAAGVGQQPCAPMDSTAGQGAGATADVQEGLKTLQVKRTTCGDHRRCGVSCGW
jgi:hypothetical protein